MANYTSVERAPISTTYHGYEIVTQAPPSNGGAPMLEMFNILENYDLKEMGFNSPEYIFTFNEALRLAMADGLTYFGDPDFYELPIDTIISKEYAKIIDTAYCGRHTHHSFQIRLPYIKGMLHQVDFHTFLTDCGTRTITDLWGVEHPVKDVDVILTRSICKGLGWMEQCGMNWDNYWDAFRRYRHALYITNVSKEKPERFTELNYQFLTTVSVRVDEFRPVDLPDGWDHSPEKDERHWLTKQTELAYYNFRANRQFRRDYFLRALEGRRFWAREKSRDYYLASVLKKNPRFIDEPVYTQALDDMAEHIVKNYAVGRLIVTGDNRYLSGDLLDLLVGLLDLGQARTKRERTFYASAFTNAQHFPNGAFYAPGATYPQQEVCTLLRNPHIARNEEIQLSCYDDKNNMRQFYFRQLTDVVMVSSNMLAAERLGGHGLRRRHGENHRRSHHQCLCAAQLRH